MDDVAIDINRSVRLHSLPHAQHIERCFARGFYYGLWWRVRRATGSPWAADYVCEELADVDLPQPVNWRSMTGTSATRAGIEHAEGFVLTGFRSVLN